MAPEKALLALLMLFFGQFYSVSTAGPVVCKTFGSGVFQTFNGTLFHVKSTCPFTLTRFTSVGVDCAITLQRSSNGLIKKMVILVNKVTTVVEGSVISVEGNQTTLPYDHTYQHVYQYGIYTRLKSKVLPFSVTWLGLPGGLSSVSVQLDRGLIEGMSGMCGRINSTETVWQLVSTNGIADGTCVTEDSKKPTLNPDCEFMSRAKECLLTKYNTYGLLCQQNMFPNVHTIAKCDFIKEVVNFCNNKTHLWAEWRKITSCAEPSCPGDLRYQDLGSAFPPTCSNPQPNSDALVSTCLPPPGKVLNDRAEGFRAVKVEDCPCKHGGRTYAPGEEISSKCQSCVCKKGKWACSPNDCPPSCIIEGQAVTTFDGKQYSLTGKCTYVAAKGVSWTVTITYSHTDMTIKEMKLDVYKDRYTFAPDSVKLGEEEITDLSQTEHATVFWQSSMFVQVLTSFGMKMQVQVSPEIQMYLYLPPTETTKGLCGTYNNNTEDDFTTSCSIIENSARPFSMSWTVDNCRSDDFPICVNSNNEIFAVEKCAQLTSASGVFAICHDYVPVNSFFEACVQRTCQCTSGLAECLCVALGNYAKACASQGIDIGDWRATSDCKPHCKGNMQFSYTMLACNRTCRSLSGPDPTCEASDDPVEGCGCLPGTLLNADQECTPRAFCTCHHPGGCVSPGQHIIDGQKCICEDGNLQCAEACDCPQGKVCVHCARSPMMTTQKTCKSLSYPLSSEQNCTSGCYCPEGQYEDHHGNCVTQDNCTCEFSGAVYSSGQEVVSNCKTCVCTGGRWFCEGESCPGVCEVFGNGQYSTFDSKWYRFDGHCQYTLVEDASGQGQFAISVESVPCCDEALTCSRTISIELLEAVTLTLRNMNVTQKLHADLKSTEQTMYSVHTTGLYIVIVVPDLGLTVVWDRHTRVKVQLHSRWKGQVRGLCGDFDGKVMNDLLTSSASVVFSTLEFGNSWKAAVPPCSDMTNEVFPCQRHSYCSAWAQRRCMIIHSDTFKDCHLKVDPVPFYEACILESCACEFEGKFLGFCTAVAAYAEACTTQHVCINWRTPDLCPVYCDYYNEEGQYSWHYEPCGQIKTCGTNNPFTGKLEGCYPRCPAVMPFYDENTRKCSSLDQCTCYFNNTVVEPGAEVNIPNDCCKCILGKIVCGLCDRIKTPEARTTQTKEKSTLTTKYTTPLSTTIPVITTTLSTPLIITSPDITSSISDIPPDGHISSLTTTIPTTTSTSTPEITSTPVGDISTIGSSTPLIITTPEITSIPDIPPDENTSSLTTTIPTTTSTSTPEIISTPVGDISTIGSSTPLIITTPEITSIPDIPPDEDTSSLTTTIPTTTSTSTPEIISTPVGDISTIGSSTPLIITTPEITSIPDIPPDEDTSSLTTTIPTTTSTSTPEIISTPVGDISTIGSSTPLIITTPEITSIPDIPPDEDTSSLTTTIPTTTSTSTPEIISTPVGDISTIGSSTPLIITTPEITSIPDIPPDEDTSSLTTTIPTTTSTSTPEIISTPVGDISTIGSSTPLIITTPEITSIPDIPPDEDTSSLTTTIPTTTSTSTPEIISTPVGDISTIGSSTPLIITTPEITSIPDIPPDEDTSSLTTTIPTTTSTSTPEITYTTVPMTRATSPSPSVPVSGHTGFCTDLMRNETWPNGMEWAEDCFRKTCRNGVIEMRAVTCPIQDITQCPRNLMEQVKDEQGCCDVWQCNCQCDVYGDPHYVSFSGTTFDFFDNCTYVLVEEIQPQHHLSIVVDNYFLDSSLPGSWPRGIILKYLNNAVTLQINDTEYSVEATLNEMVIQPPYQENGIRFESEDYKVSVYIDEIRSRVSLAPSNTLEIVLAQEHFHENTQGQCGVCGGASCVRRDGHIESEDCCSVTAYDWIEEDPAKPYCAQAPRDIPCGSVGPTPVPSMPSCEAPLCDLLLHEVFQECAEGIDVEILLQNCRFDYCLTGIETSICSPLEHLSEQCKKMDNCVSWRHLTNGICDVTCPEGMNFDECRRTTNDVCQGGMRVPGKVPDNFNSGCFCPDNQILASKYKKICVSECTNCRGPLGEPMPVGATWESNCHICTCNNQTKTEECWPKPLAPTPTCSAGSTLISDCCNNQICVETTCEYNGQSYKVGDIWTDEQQPCVTLRCTGTGTEIERTVCPEQSCSEELRVWDEHHCCYSCDVTCAVRESSMQVTVENCEQEVMLPICEGFCKSHSMWARSGEVLELEQDRRCCRESSFEMKQLTLNCTGTAPTSYTYKHITSCECQPDV